MFDQRDEDRHHTSGATCQTASIVTLIMLDRCLINIIIYQSLVLQHFASCYAYKAMWLNQQGVPLNVGELLHVVQLVSESGSVFEVPAAAELGPGRQITV